MKLYFLPGACSLAPHIALEELGLPAAYERVDTKAGKTAGGVDFRSINPKGYVPTLETDDGHVLTEAAVILQYLADLKPQAGLIPPAGTFERYQVQEWLNYIATEIHKGFSPLFKRDLPEELRAASRYVLEPKLAFLAKQLGETPYLTGERFTVADVYLLTVLRWARVVKLDLTPWPALVAFLERGMARPSVQAAMAAEGIKH